MMSYALSIDTITCSSLLLFDAHHLQDTFALLFAILSTQNIRFHYPASQYHWETYPCKGSIKDELAKINGGHQLLQTRTSNDPIIFVRYVSILRFLCLSAICDVI